MKRIDWTEIEYFEPEEFDDPDVPESWTFMDPTSIDLLNDLRRATGWPIFTHNEFGVRGCVCVKADGHSANSRHYAMHPDGCSAIDWHFDTDADPRAQALAVLQSGFTGIGVYYDWRWAGKPLVIGFHTDRRERPQIWKRENGSYTYLLK